MTQIINISNNPANPKVGMEGDTRELEVVVCEFFENGGYTQIVVVGTLTTKDANGVETSKGISTANSNAGDFDYNTIKTSALLTCEFKNISNVTKANACPDMTAKLVEQFDSQKLFD